MKRDEAITARHAQVEPRLASGETQDEEEECCGLPPGQTKRGMKSTQRRPKRYVYLGFEYGVYNG